MKAITYLRYSSEGQPDNDSIFRQTEVIEKHCKQHNLDVVQKLIDEAKSASKEKHLVSGKLGKFLANLKDFKGYAFVFENLSRFSRSGNRKTMTRLEQILDAGIQIHIAEDDLILMEADDLDNLDFSILANVKNFGNKDYTNKLTREIRSVKKSQREEIRTSGRVFTSIMPAWLKTRGRIYHM